MVVRAPDLVPPLVASRVLASLVVSLLFVPLLDGLALVVLTVLPSVPVDLLARWAWLTVLVPPVLVPSLICRMAARDPAVLLSDLVVPMCLMLLVPALLNGFPVVPHVPLNVVPELPL